MTSDCACKITTYHPPDFLPISACKLSDIPHDIVTANPTNIAYQPDIDCSCIIAIDETCNVPM